MQISSFMGPWSSASTMAQKNAAMSADERAAVLKQMQDELSDKIKQQAADTQASRNNDLYL